MSEKEPAARERIPPCSCPGGHSGRGASQGFGRRAFIKKSALGLLAGGVASQGGFPVSQPRTESEPPRIKEYRTLGRTGFKVSDLGTGDFDDVTPTFPC